MYLADPDVQSTFLQLPVLAQPVDLTLVGPESLHVPECHCGLQRVLVHLLILTILKIFLNASSLKITMINMLFIKVIINMLSM